MNKKLSTLLLCSLVGLPLATQAQSIKDGYVDWGYSSSTDFHTYLQNWTPGSQISEDDNFFISRVKPKTRFRNVNTQVRTDLDETNDKRLVAWIPLNNPTYNALPDGTFDSEVFSMWQYVNHYGNWTAPLGRVPAAFLDVAHKNGVAASTVASVPYGALDSDYSPLITNLPNIDVDKAAQYFYYYGQDGLGYNSEFSCQASYITALTTWHKNLVSKMTPLNPLFENMWYDGTNDNGGITFDRGLAAHNDDLFGKTSPVMSLFLNYNWQSRLSSSVSYANSIGRDPLYLYAGVNMQGGQPTSNNWPNLKNYPISIGLWGAHSYNMFWESRNELGSAPAVQQNTYLQRIERYFTGGTRNPANCPEITDAMGYSANNTSFHGMSSMMTARSSLSWDLSEEPFITYFNLGNGTFYNINGVRQSGNEWYNIGMQDYLPTWRWWFASSLLGRDASSVPSTGLDANFTWDDAYFGGSTISISGSTESEYLHLFKTQFELEQGDVITFRYKLAGGSANVDLLLSAVDTESNATTYSLMDASQEVDDETWVTRTFTVGSDFNGETLALVALRFTDATALDFRLGEFSIVRGSFATPAAPELTKAELLYSCKDGVDGKIIFNMANNVAAGNPVYNLDVNASYFKLYAQQEGQEPVFVGATTSWAGLCYAIPMVGDVNANVRLGVSAVSIDHKSESAITWSDYMAPPTYIYSDDIQINKTTIKPGETFTMSYVDDEHESGTWTLTNAADETVFTGEGISVTVDGLDQIGSYDLTLTGSEYNDNGGRETTTRTYSSYVQISSEGVGALPEIYTLTANDSETSIQVDANEDVVMKYTGRSADGAASQGVALEENRFGAACSNLGVTGGTSFSVAFWLKINQLAEGSTQLFSVANKLDGWPKTDWGWIWFDINQDGSVANYTFRGTDGSSNNELRYIYGNSTLPVGNWVHVAMVFDYSGSGFKSDFYINGIKQELTGWNRMTGASGTTDPGYQSQIYNITDGQVLAVGGNAHGRSGIDGTIDNFIVVGKVMTDAEVEATMGDLNESNLPDGTIAFWDLESPADADNYFTSVGELAVPAGIHTFTSAEGEGQGNIVFTEPTYTSGCPFVAGTQYEVKTLPTWRANKATITNESGNGEAGQATLTYKKDGDYSVTLTLANSLGSDQRTFQVITVGSGSGIESASTGDLRTYTVNSDLFVEFAQDGDYNVEVYTTDGKTIAAKNATMKSGSNMKVHLGTKGVYLLSVKQNGKVIRTVKLLSK